MFNSHYRINKVSGIALYIGNGESSHVAITSIVATGDQLNIEKKVIDLDEIGEIAKYILPASPVALNISGKGVLNKKIPLIEAVDKTNFSTILPNGKLEDFYVQHFSSGNYSFVSVIRKTEADKVIQKLKKLQFKVLMVSLGPFPINHIIDQLNIYENVFAVNGDVIERNENGEWLNYYYSQSATSKFELKLSSEVIHEKSIIPYAAAFQLLMNRQLELVSADISYLKDDLRKYLAEIRFKFNGFLLLITVFLLLMINFIIFSSLSASNSKLETQINLLDRTNINTAAVDSQVQRKQVFVNLLGWDNDIKKSIIIDQISSMMPEGILLKSISVNPLDQANRSQKSATFLDRNINVTGTSERISPVDEWIERMKSKRWVKKIQLVNYFHNTELNKEQFQIQINF